ncbi:unnamed protein product [Amaranthus hypochondriacus]
MGSNNKQSRLVELGSMIVFTILDIIDSILCIVYAYLDHFLETDTPSPCYCLQDSDSDSDPVSKTLYGRKRKPNLYRKLVGFINPNNNNSNNRILHKCIRNHDSTKRISCWSDCSCASCVAWIHNDARRLRLHVVVQQPEEKKVIENVIFLHGFMSSSSFWTETIFSNLSDHTKNNYRLFGVDLLGFGKSPKPKECLYTMEDHLEMIEESIIFPFKLNSFHLVAHSMGSILALALAAKYPDFIRSITLIAPPYFPTCDKEEGDEASLFILRKIAPKKLWPPLVFGTSLMSWYEHLGRTICFFICKYHKIWEFLLKLLTRTRALHFLIMDSTKHTHHSAWHTMHNVICGSAKKMEEYLAILHKARLKLIVIHGEEDQIVPVECSYNIKIKIPDADIRIIPNTNHITVVLSQIKDFTQQLELIWM